MAATDELEQIASTLLFNKVSGADGLRALAGRVMKVETDVRAAQLDLQVSLGRIDPTL